MDQKELERQIEIAFLRLPPELQEIVGNGKWIDASQEISKRNGLNIPQMGQVQNEIMLVLLGVVHPDKFLWDIKSTLNLPTEKVEKLIKEIGDAIFIPIREELTKVYVRNVDLEKEGAAEEKDESTIAPGEKTILDKAGISIENGVGSSIGSKLSENRADLLKELENPVKSQPTVLNESKAQASGGINSLTPAVRDIPVPMAPYAKDIPIATASAPAPAGDIMAGKLGGTFSVAKKETDYSIKNIGGVIPPSTQAGKDTYREPIE